MIARILVLTGCLLIGAAIAASALRAETVPPRDSLIEFPAIVGEWRGMDQPEFDPSILEVLGVDEYVNRVYQSPAGIVGLYVGYYGSQRQGDTIHSPLNCLPGAGWEPVSRSYITIPVKSADSVDRTISVNHYVIEKGLERNVVLYWYQSHGRVIANEYRSKIFMVFDAVRLNRTDAALVRIVSPARVGGIEGEAAASALAVEFVKKTFPLLDKFLPS